MKKRTDRCRRLTAMMLAVHLIMQSVLPVLALSGEVTGRMQATVTSGSTNWTFTVEDEDGYGYDATCVEPDNSTIPAVGESVSMSEADRSGRVAKIAYLGSQDGTSDKQMYIISRAAARARGEIGANSYSYLDEVNALYDDAGDMSEDIPDDFIVYIAEPSGGGQTMMAWRTIGTGAIRLQKTSENPSAGLSLAGARYGVYTTWDAADENDWDYREGTLISDEDGYDEMNVLPDTYYVKETEAPEGFLLDDTIYTVTITEDGWRTVYSEEKLSTGQARVRKVPSENEHLVEACPQQYSLAGAEYSIYTSSSLSASTKVATLTTEADGYSEYVTLQAGTYYVKETKRPKGYKLDEKVHKIVVSPNETTTFTSEETPLFDPINIILAKKDAGGNGTAPSLANAEFTVKYYRVITDDVTGYTANRAWKFKTNAAGIAGFDNSFKIGGDALFKDDNGQTVGLIGTYTIQETKAPKGYVRDPKIYYAHVTEDGTTNPDTIYNEPEVPNERKEFRLKLTKRDSETGTESQGDASLAGAVFGLYRDGKLVKRYSTGANGTFTTEYHTLGDGSHTYTVKEITPPEGYLKNTATYTLKGLVEEEITVQYTTAGQTVNNDVIKGSMALTKIYGATDDTGALNPEEGIKFQVYLKSAGSYEKAAAAEKQTITTDKYGFAQTKELPYGIYTVHQVNTFDGHDKIDDFDVYISKDGEVYRYTLNNAETRADIRVQKVDSETGKVIPAANTAFKIWDVAAKEWVSFEIKYPNPHVLDTFLTDASGTFQLPDTLDYGQYELEEQAAPEGYVLSKERIPFKVDGSSKLITVTAENIPQKGTIEITKTGEILKSVTENEDKTYTPVFEERNLSGAVFEFRAAEDIVTPDGTKRYNKDELVDTVTTDADGKAVSKALYLGKYDITETTAPVNHVLNTETFTVELTYAGQNVELTSDSLSIDNERQKAEVSLVKSMETDELYGYGKDRHKDILFGLFTEKEITAEDGTSIPAGGMMEAIGVTEEGDAYSGSFTTDLPHGQYYVQEMETSEGYILSDAKYPVEYTYKDQTTAKVEIAVNDGNAIDNKIIRGGLEGKKTDENGDALSGALMGLFMPDETEFTEETALQTDTSGLFGGFNFKDIPYGKYIVREIKAPTGFALNTTSYPVTIGEDNQILQIELVNEITKINITKTDISTGEQVIGAQLSIIPLGDNGQPDIDKPFDTWTTKAAPHYIECIPVGNYILREESAPDGYVRAEDMKFTVSDTGEIQTVEMKDDYTKVEIIKLHGETQKPLPGAFLRLYDSDGKLIREWTSSEKAERFDRLPAGIYTLKEVAAPDGYVIAEDLIIEIKETAEVQEFAMVNAVKGGHIIVTFDDGVPSQNQTAENGENPGTGDDTNIMPWMLTLSISSGLLITFCRRKREKQPC